MAFQKIESLSAAKEKLVRKASHVSCMKHVACQKKQVIYRHTEVHVTNYFDLVTYLRVSKVNQLYANNLGFH